MAHLTDRLRQAGFVSIVLFSAVVHAAESSGETARDVEGYQTTVSRYCVTCHSEKRNTANVNLEVLDFGDVNKHAELWEKMVHKIRTGDMPPPGNRRPSRRGRRRLLDWMVAELDQAARQNPNPGRPAVHRLNRAEYANAIRDLLDAARR